MVGWTRYSVVVDETKFASMNSDTPGPETLMTGLAYGESPRWHDGRLWLANWTQQEIVAVDRAGNSQVVLRLPYPEFPFSIDWLPDGRLLVVSAGERPLVHQELDGSFVDHAKLERGWNEIVVDGRGNAYINRVGFDMMAGEPFKPGTIALVTQDGVARQVAEGLYFPNGMAVTPDNATLIVAESYGRRLTAFDVATDGGLSNRRVWADLGDGVPDGICMDQDGAVCTQTFRTSVVCVFAKGERYSGRCRLTEAVLHACSAGPTERHFLFSPPNGTVPQRCLARSEPDRCCGRQHLQRVLAGQHVASVLPEDGCHDRSAP